MKITNKKSQEQHFSHAVSIAQLLSKHAHTVVPRAERALSLQYLSNVAEGGLWVFRVDGAAIEYGGMCACVYVCLCVRLCMSVSMCVCMHACVHVCMCGLL